MLEDIDQQDFTAVMYPVVSTEISDKTVSTASTEAMLDDGVKYQLAVQLWRVRRGWTQGPGFSHPQLTVFILLS